VERLADEFARRCRTGETPAVAEYAARHPEYAEQIATLFPTVALMEQLRLRELTRRRTAAGRSWSTLLPQRIGDFEIVREIGRGGMGIVYEAEQRSLGRRVAVKVLPGHVLLLDHHLQRFRREAQTAARLQHTHIVPVFGVGEQDGWHYYVMPLIRGVGLDEIIRELRTVCGTDVATKGSGAACPSGRDLADVVQRLTAQKFPSAEPARVPVAEPPDYWRAVAQIGRQAAAALDHAHRQGTLHRDIKPSNLLVNQQSTVCVADFGLARAVDLRDESRSGAVVGTPQYMAPEQREGTADVRSDVYALGLTLYELLTLSPTQAAHDRQRRVQAPVAVGSAFPRRLHPAIPRDLDTIVLKCLSPEPAKRYPTAATLEADLQRFLEDRPILARRASRVELAGRWCRRNPALAVMSAVTALLLVAIGAVALWGAVQTRRAYTEATTALARAEATSRLALEALDGIYRQLAPDRVGTAADSGTPCACVGLRSAGDSAAGPRPVRQVPVSPETAALLQGLLGFYDRLAEQDPDDAHVRRESAIASRRVGDIRQRLGQADRAETAYAWAVAKLMALQAQDGADASLRIELARAHNEIGCVRSAKLETGIAYQSHREALAVLRGAESTAGSSPEYRYELARTLYFLAGQHPGAAAGWQGDGAGEDAGRARTQFETSQAFRQEAIRILEQLTRDRPDAPDYRFLLALCYRPPVNGRAAFARSADAEGPQRALQLLEELVARYPEVADYRYELTATYAWIPVGLFPWQRPTTANPEVERQLRQSLDESQWLVTHHPAIPDYVRSRALILAKLGTVSWAGWRLLEAERFFQEAVQTQESLLAQFPDLPSHNRVLAEFFRCRLGQLAYECHVAGHDPHSLATAGQLLQTCTDRLTELTQRPELARDRLARSTLPLAHETLRRVMAELGEAPKANEPRPNAGLAAGPGPSMSPVTPRGPAG
jgi:serine/threonine protein kinase/tetratricopeptide (TPR) repeat protein